jgi:hypothetical protein
MAKVFRITREQLDSLVENAQDINIASIIKEAVLKTETDASNPHRLPRNPNHDGEGLEGLKRIYKWLNWEMASWDGHHPTMNKIYSATGDAIVEYDPTIVLDDINKETGW